MRENFNGNKGKYMDSPGGLVVKNLSANAGDQGSIPVSGRPPAGGNGNQLQSCLKNPMDRGAWWAAVHGVAKSWTRLSMQTLHHKEPGFSALQADSLPSEPPGKPNNKSIINNIILGRTYKYINLYFRKVVVVICSMQHLTKLLI